MSVASLTFWRTVWNWRPGAYARDGLRIFGWMLLRAAAQAVTVLLLARWLGAEGYGEFVAALAVASFFTPLAGLGLGAVLLIRGARAPMQLPALETQAKRIWLISSALFSFLATAAMVFALPTKHPLWALGALAVAEVAAASWVELIARRMQAEHRAHRYGAIQAGLPLARLAALGVALSLAPSSPAVWMSIYAAASLLYAALLALLLHLPCRSEREAGKPIGALLREGMPFVTSALAIRLQSEFNKPVLAHLDYAQAGALSVAQRIVDLAALPLAALQEALWPRVFAAEKPMARLWHAGGLLTLFALLLGALLALAAPLLPWLLGQDFAPAAKALVWLALLPAVQAVKNLLRMSLISLRATAGLSGIQVLSTIAGLILTVWLVQRGGIKGAVLAIFAVESLAIGLELMMTRLRLRRFSREN